MGEWTGLIWIRIGISGTFVNAVINLQVPKIRGISWLAEDLLASYAGLCPHAVRWIYGTSSRPMFMAAHPLGKTLLFPFANKLIDTCSEMASPKPAPQRYRLGKSWHFNDVQRRNFSTSGTQIYITKITTTKKSSIKSMHAYFVIDTVFWLQYRKYCDMYIYWL